MILAVVTTSPVWQAVNSQSHEHLKQLAEKLPALVMHEHAYSTEKKYVQAFKRFQEWCELMGVSYLSAAPEHVALYLVNIGLKAATAAPIEAASCAIKWAHH